MRYHFSSKRVMFWLLDSTGYDTRTLALGLLSFRVHDSFGGITIDTVDLLRRLSILSEWSLCLLLLCCFWKPREVRASITVERTCPLQMISITLSLSKQSLPIPFSACPPQPPDSPPLAFPSPFRSRSPVRTHQWHNPLPTPTLEPIIARARGLMSSMAMVEPLRSPDVEIEVGRGAGA